MLIRKRVLRMRSQVFENIGYLIHHSDLRVCLFDQ